MPRTKCKASTATPAAVAVNEVSSTNPATSAGAVAASGTAASHSGVAVSIVSSDAPAVSAQTLAPNAKQQRRLRRQVQEAKRANAKTQSLLSTRIQELMDAQTAANARIAELSDALRKQSDLLTSILAAVAPHLATAAALNATSTSRPAPPGPGPATAMATSAAGKRTAATTSATSSSSGFNIPAASKRARKAQSNAPAAATTVNNHNTNNFGRNITNYFAQQSKAGRSVFGAGLSSPSSSSLSQDASSERKSDGVAPQSQHSSKDEIAEDEDDDEFYMGTETDEEILKNFAASQAAHSDNPFGALSTFDDDVEGE